MTEDLEFDPWLDRNPGTMSALDLVEDAVRALERVAPPPDGELVRVLGRARQHLERALDEELWGDESHLVVPEGRAVFVRLQSAVRTLRQIRGETDDPVEDLVAAAALLAGTVLEESDGEEARGPVVRELARAEDEVGEAEEELLGREPELAVEHYRKAWEHACRAARAQHRE